MLLRSTALLPIGLACLAGVSGCGGDGLSPGGDGSGGGGGGETGGGGGARSNGVALVDWLRSMVEKASFDSVACQGAECEQPTPEGNQATSATREIAAVHAIATRRTTLQAVAGSACRVTCTPNHPATTPVGTTASHEERPVNFG